MFIAGGRQSADAVIIGPSVFHSGGSALAFKSTLCTTASVTPWYFWLAAAARSVSGIVKLHVPTNVPKFFHCSFPLAISQQSVPVPSLNLVQPLVRRSVSACLCPCRRRSKRFSRYPSLPHNIWAAEFIRAVSRQPDILDGYLPRTSGT